MTVESRSQTARQCAQQDCELVVRAAQWRDISEYEFFADAYRAWHREAPDGRHVDEMFAAFMFGNVVPFWVRDYARKTLRTYPNESAQPSRRVAWRDVARFVWSMLTGAESPGRGRRRLDFTLLA